MEVGPSLTAVLEGVGGRGLGNDSEAPQADKARDSPKARKNVFPVVIMDLDTGFRTFFTVRACASAAMIFVQIMLSEPPDRTTLWG